jgi:hypothetical protein
MTTRKDLFPEGKRTPLFIVIDEAQVAAEKLKWFPSTSGNGPRPILRQMVRFFKTTLIFNKTILSGTGLSMGMVKNGQFLLLRKRCQHRFRKCSLTLGVSRGMIFLMRLIFVGASLSPMMTSRISDCWSA